MTQEVIDLINQIDTAHYITYLYGCIFVLGILLTIYVVGGLILTIIKKKKQTKFIENQNRETQNLIREYEKINIFTKVK